MGLCVLYYAEYSLYNVKKVEFFFYLGWNFNLKIEKNCITLPVHKAYSLNSVTISYL